MTHKQLSRFTGKLCRVGVVGNGDICGFVGVISIRPDGRVIVGQSDGTGFVVNSETITWVRMEGQTSAPTILVPVRL